MTSINAMRFDAYSGVLVCDEQRLWNKEQMAINSCDKIRSIIREDIQEELGIVACYGNTGTSSIGDEFCETMKKRIGEDFDRDFRKPGKKPKIFKTIEEIAHQAYEIMTEIKRKQTDSSLKGKYGFTANEYIHGSYKKNSKTYEIKDKDVINAIPKYLTWEGRSEEATAVFLNAGIIAGYEPSGGFRIFTLSLIEPVCEPVQEIFFADGSGLDICDHMYTAFANARSIPERRGNVERVEGLMAMIDGVNVASTLCAGVGGYLKIICIDGREKNHLSRMNELQDFRSKLASEIVAAQSEGLINKQDAIILLNELIFKNASFKTVNDRFLRSAKNDQELFSFLRGY